MAATTIWKPGDRCLTCNLLKCNCVRCNFCGKRVPKRSICDKCAMCAEHHLEYYPKDFPHRHCQHVGRNEPPANTFIINPLQRTLGVEIELGSYGTVRNEPGNKHINWEMAHDGSVAGSGQELVTHPMSGDRYIYGMSALTRRLLTDGAVVNSSCGYHVHVDAAEMGPMDLRRILVAFYLVQNNLYGTLVSPTRDNEWGRTYCAKLRCDPAEIMLMEDKAVFVNWLHNWLYGVTLPAKTDYEGNTEVYRSVLRKIDSQLKQFKNTKYMNRARRWALNFHSWMMRGTLEFRLKEGTLNPGDLIMWPLWCAWFIQRFGNCADKDIHYFMKKGLSVQEASEFMATGSKPMPDYVMDWVKEKANG